MGDKHDLVAGHLILDVFIAYIAHLIENGRARSTLKKHANYLWALGGEIIRDTSEVGFDKSKPSYDVSVHSAPSLTHRYRSDRIGESANFSFHNLGVREATSLAGCRLTRCNTSTR